MGQKPGELKLGDEFGRPNERYCVCYFEGESLGVKFHPGLFWFVLTCRTWPDICGQTGYAMLCPNAFCIHLQFMSAGIRMALYTSIIPI